MSFYTYPTFKKKEHGADTRYIQGHILVAPTFVGSIPSGYDVHHIDGHPKNNTASNLRILSREDHMKLHKNNFHKVQDNKEMLTTCSVCLAKNGDARWCECQKAYRQLHIIEHQQTCWYHQHDLDPEYNEFVQMIVDGKEVPKYEINQKAKIRHVSGGKIRITYFHNGYPKIKLYQTTPSRFVHSLMASTFFGDQMKPGIVVDHKNSNHRLNHFHTCAHVCNIRT
ncbi:hypothetical protein MBANPS3_005369 [Mucor bainieri]